MTGIPRVFRKGISYGLTTQTIYRLGQKVIGVSGFNTGHTYTISPAELQNADGQCQQITVYVKDCGITTPGTQMRLKIDGSIMITWTVDNTGSGNYAYPFVVTSLTRPIVVYIELDENVFMLEFEIEGRYSLYER